MNVFDRAWFVYAKGARDGVAFDDVPRFRTRVIPYDGSDAWVEPALREAFTKHKSDLVFMDFIIDPKANVFPMVAAGKGLSEMILAEDL